MQKVRVEYGTEQVWLEVNAECVSLLPREPSPWDEATVLNEGLASQHAKIPLTDFLKDANDLLVIVSDTTRATPTARVLEKIFPLISKVPDLKFLVGVGTHPPPSIYELKCIFGKLYDSVKEKIIIHESRDDSQLVKLGTTSRGTPVFFNKLVVKAGWILTISNVEPHYFAGFSGGRKSFLPAITGYDTIEKNHSHALSENSYPMALEGNPVHEDMVEALEMFDTPKIFTIQTVLNHGKIYRVFTGDINQAFYSAVDIARELFCCPLAEKADIVVTCVPPPKDINFYQSQHALENGKLALKNGGIIIWVSKCRDGVGNDSFLKLLAGVENYDDVKESLRQGYKLGYHKAAKIMQLKQRAEIWTVTSLANEVIESAKMKPYNDIQSALDDAIAVFRKRGQEPKVVVMPNGGGCVPYISTP
ncbi:MAG: nickel-dependent lactate racemase [Candidatus Thermoplasmatota archaeon]|nr:nickel-dependent lactate racemase [Candidatus Thermoplasmatota archaeon]MBU4591465.1 nickel-dependent lactate racemase [Candidatus Thermoplasmatota archaeon]